MAQNSTGLRLHIIPAQLWIWNPEFKGLDWWLEAMSYSRLGVDSMALSPGASALIFRLLITTFINSAVPCAKSCAVCSCAIESTLVFVISPIP